MAVKYSIPEHLKRVKNIAEGALLSLNGDNQELYEKRIAICKGTHTGKKCGFFTEKLGERCRKCFCSLSWKLRMPKQHCPLDNPKW